MRRNWRGRGFGYNWNRSRKNVPSNSGDGGSVKNSAASARISSTTGSSRSPANQLPVVIPLSNGTNIWKLYFPLEG